MTRLTLDTIALCGFGYRFNSFYRETPHPFVAGDGASRSTSRRPARQLPIQPGSRSARSASSPRTSLHGQLVDDLIRERRAVGEPPTARTCSAGCSPESTSSRTTLPDENILAQCITFLVAGHETTSGLLSFAIYFLLKNPEYLARAREEVDRVLGGRLQPTFAQVHELPTSRQILDETLRLWPTAPGSPARHARTPSSVAGYAIPADTAIMVLIPDAAP